MLDRSMRLSRAHVASSGPEKRQISAHFSVSVRVAEAAASGGAAVVSKKVARLSVARHLLKRRIFAVLRPHLRPDRAVIVYARAGAAALPFSELEAELSELLARALR